MFMFLLLQQSFALPPRTGAVDSFYEIDDIFSLYFLDAVSGNPVQNATVTFEGVEKTTAADGVVRFPIPEDIGDGVDIRKVKFQKDSYTESSFDVHFQVGKVWFNRFSVSPSLPLKKIRIVLDWDKSPRDLDAHLVKENSYHISYRDKRSVKDLAALDRDDTDGYGAETITMHSISSDATYRFFVHNYSDKSDSTSKTLSNSVGRVHIFTAQGKQETFHVPTNVAGTVWNVFRIVNGKIVPEQTVE